jgi:ribosomal protein S18 acetylase RimI-like enzyme
LRILPKVLQLTGLMRLPRGAAMAAAMEHAHPKEPYFYLAFLGVAPRMQGSGLGSSLLRQTLQRADAAGVSAYLENSNPRNLRLYENAGFSVLHEIRARGDAPPVFAMRRPARSPQGSRTMSQ